MNVVQESAPAMAATSDHTAAGLMLDLSAARHVWLSKSSVALLLKSGRLVLAHLTIEAGMVKQMRVSHLPVHHAPMCHGIIKRMSASLSVLRSKCKACGLFQQED